MKFGFASTWSDSLLELSPPEVVAAIDFAREFQRNPAQPGHSLERVHSSAGTWSARISSELRAVLAKEGELWLFLHAGHHDEAYRWARNRKLSTHPVTGVLQIVQVVETIEHRIVVRDVPGLFQDYQDDYLVSLGVPPEWLPTVRQVTDDDQLLRLADGLPEDVQERLFHLADGELVTPPTPVEPGKMFEHPDVRARFYLVESDYDMQRLLSAPLAKWLAFLHPSQQKLATGKFNGPVKVTGSAGTGKTVVAMHRARHLASQGKRVLLTTYVNTLVDNLKHSLGQLCSPEELERITVGTVHAQAQAMVKGVRGVPDEEVLKRIEQNLAHAAGAFDARFLLAEWSKVLSPAGIRTWEAYRTARRVGRGRALSVKERATAWRVFEQVIESMDRDHLEDFSGICRRALESLEGPVFDGVVVDEVQDLKAQELKLLAALGRELMLVGDAGQRIYPGGASLSALGIKTQGRSYTLRINYRTTEQIRRFADRVLGRSVEDLDGELEERKGTRSLLRGPEPEMQRFGSSDGQNQYVMGKLRALKAEKLEWEDIALFVRTNALVERWESALHEAGIPVSVLGKKMRAGVRLGTMHRAKGLEFKSVLVLDASDRYLPNPSLLSNADLAERDDLLGQERRLLYVSLTRARDDVVVTCVGEPSPFLSELLVAAR